MQICPTCQVEKHGLVFKTDYDRKKNTTSTPDFIRTRICCHAKGKGCINTEGQVNKALDYNNLGVTTEMWVETARELIEGHKLNTATPADNS